MHEVTVVLYDCAPLSARLSREDCIKVHAKSRAVQFNNDLQGDPYDYEKCKKCKGLNGTGEEVAILASGPSADRALVPTIYGGVAYVR